MNRQRINDDDLISPKLADLARFDADLEVHQLLRASLDDRFRSFVGLRPGTFCDDGSVVVGEAGFLFVNDGSNQWRKQLSGEAVISEAACSVAREFLVSSANKASSFGMNFIVVIYPEKDIIYPELSPNISSGIPERRSIHRIMVEDVTFVYPADTMFRQKGTYQQFHRRNSHVCYYGGLIAANATLRALGEPCLDGSEIQTDLVNWPDDLSIKWVDGLDTLRRRVRPVFRRTTVTAPLNGHVGTEVETFNETAEVDEFVMIFGDSYSWNQDAGLVSFLSLHYRRVYFVWRKEIDWALVEKMKPNKIILQSAERFLIRGFAQ